MPCHAPGQRRSEPRRAAAGEAGRRTATARVPAAAPARAAASPAMQRRAIGAGPARTVAPPGLPRRSVADYADANARAVDRVSSARAARGTRGVAGGGVVQRYTNHAGRKLSEHGAYATDGTSEMLVNPGSTAVERSRDTGRTARYNGIDYQIWEPAMDVIGDCVAAAEEIMHGQTLKYGAPGISHFRDAPGTPEFGASDASNRTEGAASDLDHNANPPIGEAYVIVRQTFRRNRARPQMHGAAVVAQDGIDNVTLEATAPLSGAIDPDRVTPVYDMYASLRRRRQGKTFKTTYQGEYGKDATVSVIAPTRPLKRRARDSRPSLRWKPY